MHLWPSLRIRDSFKHAYLEKLELNLARKKRAQQQRQQGQDQAQQQEAPLLEGRASSRGSMVAGALELAWDATMLLTCCCCCFCCGACGEEDDHLSSSTLRLTSGSQKTRHLRKCI